MLVERYHVVKVFDLCPCILLWEKERDGILAIAPVSDETDVLALHINSQS